MADEVANIALTKVVPTATTITPYYDDFDESKNFHRVLFKPGYAVQARELTQIQTILQNQVERFGSHVFKNGSIVHGGQISIDVTNYINVQSQYLSNDITASNFKDKIIVDASGNNTFEAAVIATREKTSDTNPVLIIAYRSGEEFHENQVIKISGEEVYAQITPEANVFTGKGTFATINDGIFFFNGYFIKKPRETIIVDPYSKYANAKVGLEFTESIISVNDDLTLLDPAQEASNYQAPGADRLQIDLKFTTRPLDSEDEENFIELLRIENGIRTYQVVYPIYSVLGDTMARRTFDESGNYTVRPFRTRIEEDPDDDTSLRLYISPGKAYVKGYELESIAETYISLDKARDSDTLNNIDILANYGNDTIIKNYTGIVDVGSMPIVDLHCVPHSSVDTTSATTYNTTKIGTARIRSMEFYGASNVANVLTHTYDVSLFDLSFKNITSNVVSVNTAMANSLVISRHSNKLTSATNAYAGGIIRFTSGNANGSSYLIKEYNGSNGWFLLDKKLGTTAITSADTVSIDGSFAIVESLYSNTNAGYTTNAVNNMKADIDDANRNASGYTYLFDQSAMALVFKAPSKFIVPSSMTDQQYQYSKTFTSSFNGGVCTISVNPSKEAFNGVDGSGSSMSVLDNFIVSLTSTGEVIRLDSVVVNGTTGVATLTYGTYTGPATIIAKVNMNSGQYVKPKAKALNIGNIDTFANTAVSGTFVSSELGSTIDVYLNSGQARITNPTSIAGAKQYLHVSDIRRVTKIYDAEGAVLVADDPINACKDVTERFDFFNGQKSSIYDYGWIQLKPKKTPPKGPLIVCFDWYDHVTGEGDDKGYFCIDSYPDVDTTAGYADVPVFTDDNGLTYDLRDCVDFRPRKKNCEAISEGFTVEGARIPNQATNFECDLGYYLPRADLLVVSKEVRPPFLLQKGSSSLSPVYPKSIEGSMPIYKINLDPYTINKDNVSLKYVENKRYTMRDIGILEKRIENLEYYVTLSILEKTATDMVIKDANGLDRTKNGILVDNFFTHGIGNVYDPDYFVSMDKLYGAAAPPVNSVVTKFFVAQNIYSKTGKKLTTLDYTETPAIIQPYATKSLTVQPYQVAIYIGVMTMDPPADFWVEQEKGPTITVNINGENDNSALGTSGSTNQNDNRCIRTKMDLVKYIVSLGGTAALNSKKPKLVQYLKSYGHSLSITDRMNLANLVNTALCKHNDVGIWSSGRGNILSSWFGKTTR